MFCFCFSFLTKCFCVFVFLFVFFVFSSFFASFFGFLFLCCFSFGVISHMTLRLQKIWEPWFPEAKETSGNARTDTKSEDTPITVTACTEHRHTIPHSSWLKQTEKSWTNECDNPRTCPARMWKPCRQDGRQGLAHRSARVRTTNEADITPTCGVKLMLPYSGV